MADDGTNEEPKTEMEKVIEEALKPTSESVVSRLMEQTRNLYSEPPYRPDLTRIMENLPEIVPLDQQIVAGIEESQKKEMAENYAKILYEQAVEFDKSLDQKFEAGVLMINGLTFGLREIGYKNPSIIIFKGVLQNSGEPVELLQHVTQINILFAKIARCEPEEEKNPIGFIWDEK